MLETHSFRVHGNIPCLGTADPMEKEVNDDVLQILGIHILVGMGRKSSVSSGRLSVSAIS